MNTLEEILLRRQSQDKELINFNTDNKDNPLIKEEKNFLLR